MKTNIVIIVHLMFYLLGVYHFGTFNILGFWEVESIVYNHPDSLNSFYFLLTCEIILLSISYIISKELYNEKQ